MTRSFKYTKQLPKSNMIMIADHNQSFGGNLKSKKAGAGKFSWGLQKDLIDEAILDAYDPEFNPNFSSNARYNSFNKIHTVAVED